MKKFYNKVPLDLQEKVNNFGTDEVIVAGVLEFRGGDFENNPVCQRFGIRMNDGLITTDERLLPEAARGRYSKKNVTASKITHRQLPKIWITYYAGERPVFGDWSRGSFDLYISKQVFQKTIVPPKEYEILVEYLESREIDNELRYIFKFSMEEPLDRSDPDFSDNLLLQLNLLHENVGTFDVFELDADNDDFIRNVALNWDIFPPGNRDEDIERIIRGLRNPNQNVVARIRDRYDYLMSLGPIDCIQGLNGLRRYFGMRYADDLVVFENMYSGNAIYILFGNWVELSRMSRSEILNRPPDEYVRIEHRGQWQRTLRDVLDNRLGRNAA